MRNVAIVALALSSSSMAFAKDLKPAQEQAKAAFETSNAETLKALDAACGTHVTLSSDYENFKAEEWAGSSAASWCTPAIQAIRNMCARNATYKKAIGSKLKTFSCLFAGVKADKTGGGPKVAERNMSFDKGTFTFHIDQSESGIDDATEKAMDAALNK